MLTRKRLFTVVLWCMAVLAFVQPLSAQTAEAAKEKDEPEVAAAALTINWTLKNGKVGTSYSDFITAGGGSTPYKWTYTGTLPPGLKSTYSGTGERLNFTGKPTKAGTYSFTVKVTDRYKRTATKYLTVKITSALVINYTLVNGKAGTSYSDFVTASGGTAPYKWTYTGTMPPGLKGTYSGTGSKLTVSGKPTKAGTYTFTLKVTDKNKATATKSLTVKIASALTINWTLKDGKVGTSYSDFITAGGGTAPYKWTYTGTMPPGLKGTYSGTGEKLTVSGKPTKAGTYTFTLKVTDKNKATATKSLTVKIASALTINWTLKDGKAGTYYSDFITASGGSTPYKWTYTGSLPPGIRGTYSGTGEKLTFSGVPTKTGTYYFTVKVTDKSGRTATKSLSIKIASAYSSSLPVPADDNYPADGSEVFITSLSVASDDIIEAGEGRDSDIITVKVGEPVSFQVGTWVRPNGTFVTVDDAVVFVDDEPLEDVIVAEDGTFELPAEMTADDFKVYVKGAAGSEELETEELYIRAEE